jgi:hypothetical protein
MTSFRPVTSIDVSEEYIASIFGVEKQACCLLHAGFLDGLLKMVMIFSPKTQADYIALYMGRLGLGRSWSLPVSRYQPSINMKRQKNPTQNSW